MGSRIQRRPEVPIFSASSSPRMPSSGKQALELLADQALGAAVGHGDRGAVALAVDGEVVAAEVLEGEVAGLAQDGDGGVEQLGFGGRCHGGIIPRAAPPRRGPGGQKRAA